MAKRKTDYNAISKSDDEKLVLDAFEVHAKDLPVRIRIGPGMGFSHTGEFVEKNPVKIVDVVKRPGSKTGWGLLASHEINRDGWVALDYVDRVD